MKKLLCLILAFSLITLLCACGADNNLSQDKLKGTWSIDISMNELLALYVQEMNAAIGFGDLSCLVGGLTEDYPIPFLLVFDGENTATAYLDTELFNIRMRAFSQYLLTEDVLLRVLDLENATEEEISASLGGLDIDRLTQILQLQFSSADFATNLAQSFNYKISGEYVVIPVSDSYVIDGNHLLIGNGSLEYDGANLLLTQHEDLTTIGFNLDTAPLTFTRTGDKTAY